MTSDDDRFGVKLLFAIKSLSVEGGGAERVLVDVANGLDARGHQVEVLTFDFGGASYYPLRPSVPRHDMCFNPPGKPLPVIPFLRSLPRLHRTISKVAPDVIIAFMHSTFVPIAAANIGYGAPLIASEHTEARHYEGRPLQKLMSRFVNRFATLRTVPSNSVLEGFASWHSGDALVAPNPVDLQEFKAHDSFEPSATPVVLAVGRLMAEKDHLTLLRAFSLVNSEFPEWRLRIVGEGPFRLVLEEEVRRLGLDGKVEMPGADRYIATVYRSAAFVAISSRYESFGMVAAEALASSRPVLAFDDCAGLHELVRHGENGLLAKGSPEPEVRAQSLAGAMRMLMSDEKLRARLGAAAPAAVQHYGIEAVLDRWEEIAEAACSRR